MSLFHGLASVILSIALLTSPGARDVSFQPPGFPTNHPHCAQENPRVPLSCWWYVKAVQTSFAIQPVGVQGWFTVERPVVQGGVHANYHSLAAMYISNVGTDGSLYDGVEVGWAVAPGIYTDEEPHLFVFPSIHGQQRGECWADPTRCGWTPTPGAKHRVGEYIQPAYGTGTDHPFSVTFADGRWNVLFDQENIGSFPESVWGGSFVKADILAWYGEVQTVNAPGGPGCTYMGNGKFGTDPGSAKIGGMAYLNIDAGGWHLTWAHPSVDGLYGNEVFYKMGDHLSASWFTYGGPGGDVHGNGNVRACPSP